MAYPIIWIKKEVLKKYPKTIQGWMIRGTWIDSGRSQASIPNMKRASQYNSMWGHLMFKIAYSGI